MNPIEPIKNQNDLCVARRRKRFDDFIQTVPLLQHLDAVQRADLKAAIEVVEFAAGPPIVTRGESGADMYFLEEGGAEAERGGLVVMTYEAGDFFG